MLYIDAFNHILPKKYQAVLEQKVPNRDMSSNLSRYAETVPTLLDLDARFRLMDSVEGYMQVLTLAAPTVESVASPEVAVDLCRFANDEMAELVEKYPDRFAAAIAALPLNDLDASLKEIDRAIRDLRLRGIQMYSVNKMISEIAEENHAVLNAKLLIETGRFITCNAGKYYTPIVDIKESLGQKYLIVENAMNGFMRPAIANLIYKAAGEILTGYQLAME